MQIPVTIIVERTWAGKESSGNFGGRKPRLTPQQKDEVGLLFSQGASKAELARQFNVSRMTIMRTVENTEVSKA